MRPASTALAVIAAAAITFAQSSKAPMPRAFGAGARIVVTPRSLPRLFADPPASWKPAVNRDRMRGDAVELYTRVAPAVVVVRTRTGHGTGFFIDERGTIITNHHVIEDGLGHDPARNASYAMVHLGRLDAQGIVTLQPAARRAYVYKWDPVADLALLRIDAAAGETFPFLTLADQPARPGSAITIVGHPSSGMLWTIRSGQVASVGRMPADLVNTVLARLAASSTDRAQIEKMLVEMPSTRILLTSAGVNPGDSGGPVVDPSGRVVAVTYAIPIDPAEAKFAYHVHLDELKAFLASVPARPSLKAPDPWQIGPRAELQDVDGDSRPDLLVSGSDAPDAYMFDLDNSTARDLVGDLETLIEREAWDFEVMVRETPGGTDAFYDTNNDGTIDLILAIEDERPETARFTRAATGEWRVETVKSRLPLTGRYFTAPRLGARFDTLMAALRGKDK